jgi:hypothetical protein
MENPLNQLINFKCGKREKKKFQDICRTNGYKQSSIIKMGVNEKLKEKVFEIK